MDALSAGSGVTGSDVAMADAAPSDPAAPPAVDSLPSDSAADLPDGGLLDWLQPRLPAPAELQAARPPRAPLETLDLLARADGVDKTLLAAAGTNIEVRTLLGLMQRRCSRTSWLDALARADIVEWIPGTAAAKALRACRLKLG